MSYKRLIVTIKPESTFGSEIRGDTLFGHLCWQLFLNNDNPERYLANYSTKPFLVTSCAFGWRDKKILLPKPHLPFHLLNTAADEELYKKSKYWLVDQGTALDSAVNAYQTSDELIFLPKEEAHNKINRLTGTTGSAGFAPFSGNAVVYGQDITLIVICVYDDGLITETELRGLFELVGSQGYGKNASTGKGQFSVNEVLPLNQAKFNTSPFFYLTAPFVPESRSYTNAWFKPFSRFGKHGMHINGIKNVVVSADTGSVVSLSQKPERPFIGRAVTNVSVQQPEAIVQGYCPIIQLGNELFSN